MRFDDISCGVSAKQCNLRDVIAQKGIKSILLLFLNMHVCLLWNYRCANFHHQVLEPAYHQKKVVSGDISSKKYMVGEPFA